MTQKPLIPANKFPYNKGGAAKSGMAISYIINWQDRGQGTFIGKAAADGRNVSNYPDELKFQLARGR